jgi:hypothetical protein
MILDAWASHEGSFFPFIAAIVLNAEQKSVFSPKSSFQKTLTKMQHAPVFSEA